MLALFEVLSLFIISSGSKNLSSGSLGYGGIVVKVEESAPEEHCSQIISNIKVSQSYNI